MHYTELLRGVNAFRTGGENKLAVFPGSLYLDESSDAHYLDVIDAIRDAAGNAPAIVQIAMPFLKRWVRRVGFDEAQLLKAIRHFSPQIGQWKLQEIPLWQSRVEIIKLFGEFSSVVKFTGASKALHILSPEFFMMWDERIRHGYGCYKNGEGYFNFLLRSQMEIHEITETYSKDHGSGRISQKIYQGRVRSEVKLLDEYNFARFTKEWI
ncbi:MAG: hypothetical protein ACFFB3_04550 [Candidatus Hodarchaeota archaeon]